MGEISSNGLGIVSPLFISNIQKIERLENQLIEVILLISKKLKLRKIILLSTLLLFLIGFFCG